MKPSRLISHTLANVMIKNAERSLEPKRIVASLVGRGNDAFISAIRQKYADAVLYVLQKNGHSVISDYVIDLVEMVQPVLEKEFKAKELQAISKIISSPAFASLIQNDAFMETCYAARDKMNNKILDLVNGDEVYNIMKIATSEAIDDITRSFGLDDEASS